MKLYPVATTSRQSRRLRHLSGEFDHRANLLWLADARETKGLAVHELMHFFEHCSTPYGRFQDEMHQRTLDLTLQFLKEYEGPVFVPMFRWIERFLNDPMGNCGIVNVSRFEELIGRVIKPWSMHAHVWQVLDGYDSEHVRGASVPELRDLLLTVEGDADGSELAALFEGRACPPVQCDGTGDNFLAIGARHVSECIAQIQEGFADLDTEKMSPVYVVLLLLGNDYIVKAETMFGKAKRDLEMTSLALADLSLFTPIGRTYGHLRHPALDWPAVHPGWRYCHALELVAKEDWWIDSLFEAEGLATRICDRFQWPHPRRFLDHGSQLTDAKAQRHRAACEIRQDDFMAFYRRDRLFDFETPVGEFLIEHLPMVHYSGVGTVCNVSPGDKDNATALKQLRDCFLTRRYGDAMLESLQQSVLPPDCMFERYFEDVLCESDLERWIAQKYPWLDTSRFVPLLTR